MTKNKGIVNWYENLLASNHLQQDDRQREVVAALQQFNDQKPLKGNLFSRRSSHIDKGIYLYGTVGRGKTLLMDGFYLNTHISNKWRVHFHAFMRYFHHRMQKMRGQAAKDKVKILAAELANEYQLICFDEFHVSDIADAMILAGILRTLINHNVRLVMTSNYAPADLYPNGLARHLFVPTIRLIKENFRVLNLDGNKDYRHQPMHQDSLYFYPLNHKTQLAMKESFAHFTYGIDLDPKVDIEGRDIQAVKRTSDAIWFDFNILCGGNYSRMDYLRLAKCFGTIFLSNIPQLNNNSDPTSRRFTWLVDILYDQKVNLVMSAAMPLDQLYAQQMDEESSRTLSRLYEMQDHAYRKKQPIKNGGADGARTRDPRRDRPVL